MNLPLGSRVIIDRTNEPNHAPGELVLVIEAPGLEIEARHNESSGDYILHGSVVRGPADNHPAEPEVAIIQPLLPVVAKA